MPSWKPVEFPEDLNNLIFRKFNWQNLFCHPAHRFAPHADMSYTDMQQHMGDQGADHGQHPEDKREIRNELCCVIHTQPIKQIGLGK